MNRIKLAIELVPTTCFWSNVRSTVKAKDWDKIRFITYAEANHTCEICGENGIDQGYRHRVECHEIWKYDDRRKIQKLIGLIALCPKCHIVKHFGRATATGNQGMAMKRLQEINNWSHKDAVTYLATSYEQQKERSRHQWMLDISLLSNNPYDIIINVTTKRKFKKTKWKRKRRKK
jgi:5-methylcytosine-specific restriction endonuclease McrA